MGIANRDYYRESTSSNWTLGDSPAVKYLILITAGVFLLQIFSVREVRLSARDAVERIKKRNPHAAVKVDDPELEDLPAIRYRESAVTEWLELDPVKVVRQGQVWRLVTHAF